MTSQEVPQKRFTFTLRRLLSAVTALCILLGFFTAVYRWQIVQSVERQAQAALRPYGGVHSMASALYSIRTGGQSKGWFFETFLNHVEEVDLSPHNWSAKQRRGETVVVDEDALVTLLSFNKLRSLDLRDTRVTDGGVRHIVLLKRLEQLDIRGTRITDDGLHQLRLELPNCVIIQ